MIITPKEKVGIACKCDGCRGKIKDTDVRETVSDYLDDGSFFSKTFCRKCINDIVEAFKKHVEGKDIKVEPNLG